MEKVQREVLSAAMIGTILEWYGIFLFSSGAVFIAHAFLPKGNAIATIAETLFIFAIGFFMRPVGAIFFGHFGDRMGRKRMLLYTLLISGISTGLVGILPTYASAGVFAIILLIILRLLLGFGLGGEWGGAMLLDLENFKTKRGLWGSFVQSTVGIGLILGALAFLILTTILPSAAMYSYGWRIPYLLAFVVLIVGIFIRLRIPETPVFEAAQKERKIAKYPISELFRNHKVNLLLSTLIVASSGTIYYIGVTLLPTLFEVQKIVTVHFAQFAIIGFALAEITFVFIGGVLSDRFGRRVMAIVANVIFIVIVFPSILSKAAAALVVFMVLYGTAHGIGYTAEGDIISEIFPTNVRYTGNSFAYQFANAYVAGPAPYASIALGAVSVFLYPLYGLVFSFLAIASAVKIKETKDVTLGEEKSEVPAT
ncbi:MAG: MFS transporter [Thermoplasmatales archaeon]|nr:MFS transporter [Candidatus Thermoplasmatota archaeon]MCL6002679.1 MFS transporter [Candidatus Thermoplasmatota archaeon]MDA8054805.1 MFS transporter [Thermoplasmatales archaeon]